MQGTAFSCFQRKNQLGWMLQTGKHSVWFPWQKHPLTALYMGVWHSLNCEWTKPDASVHWKVKSSSRKIQRAVNGGNKCIWKTLTFSLTNATWGKGGWGGMRGKNQFPNWDLLCTQIFVLKMGYPYTWNGSVDMGPVSRLFNTWDGCGRETGEKQAASPLTPSWCNGVCH